ncbi:transglutaminase-like domain-containing protein [Actinomadura scrupuli]|uniref:transglutaminase-like domain-containing protein n=1 Tax=Actinomadura scrupuli TaxID=559629 RepID=UPI003D95988A
MPDDSVPGDPVPGPMFREALVFLAEPWEYLGADEAIDLDHPLVQTTAARLPAGDGDAVFARAAYELVRDTITHSADAGDRRVTWRASDVLRERTGLCYAKSHAYVALLRAAGIPAGLCYQRLARDETGSAHVLHGLTAVCLDGSWFRLDPRGDRPGVPAGAQAAFSLGEERLAFVVRPGLGEVDYPQVYASPAPAVLDALRRHDDRRELCDGHLPAGLDPPR